MVKYTRGRGFVRRLYERYDRSAAAVINELGYPSRQMLTRWHRAWVEAGRDDDGSLGDGRGERYMPGQKRAAVDHYLRHGRCAVRTIRALGYPCRALLSRWVDELEPGRRRIRRAFEQSRERYGYRRIWRMLRDRGIHVCARRVMRLMTGHGIVPKLRSHRRYSSCSGEHTPAPANIVRRDFHAGKPNRLWVTDITEFRICERHGLTRSMSAKGCSPDNAAAEGLFGRLKQESYHNRGHRDKGIDEFIDALDDYMVWYRGERIKTEYGMSIRRHRQALGLMA